MALTISLTPGAVVTEDDLLTVALLNLLANPTIKLEGSVSSLALADGSVTTAKLADLALAASAAGRGKMQDGFFSADATGRAKFANNFLTAALMEETAREGVMQYAAGIQTATVYAVTLSPAATAYTEGMRIAFKADTANVAAVSVNINGLGNKALKRCHPSGLLDLAANDLVAGRIVTAIYDGTVFQVTSDCAGLFVGAENAIVAGLVGNVVHGLGTKPSVVRWVLVNKTAELGYSIGDEVGIEQQDSSGSNVMSAGASATNVWCAVDSLSFALLNKTTGNRTGATAGNWRLKCYARL